MNFNLLTLDGRRDCSCVDSSTRETMLIIEGNGYNVGQWELMHSAISTLCATVEFVEIKNNVLKGELLRKFRI